MPLYKRKPFLLEEPPQNVKPHEHIFQVRFTKEIFQDYQEYLNRLNLYRQRVWTCKVTGKTNLTYEEALVSEHRATEMVQQIPKELTSPVLRMIQYSKLGLKELVNSIYIKLQECLFEGMELLGRKQQSVRACKILKILEDREAIQYEVGWMDQDKELEDTSIVKEEDLIRKKAPLSRNILKAFIREATSRSAPWVVKEKLVKQHGISTVPPEELRELIGQNGFLNGTKESKKRGRKDAMDAQNLKASEKRKTTENEGSPGVMKKAKKEEDKPVEVPIKYPIDDILVQPAADDPIFTDRPPLSPDFSVPMECVGDLLMVWNFCSSFSMLLNLWPFSFEDLENAICHKDSNLILIVESHSAILRLLIKDEGSYFRSIQKKKQKLKIRISNWTEYLCNFLEMENRPDLSSHVTTIKRGHYGLLDIHIKVAIFCELVKEALATNAIRERLDECIEQQQAIVATKRAEARQKKEEMHPEKEEPDKKKMNQRGFLENGEENLYNSASDGVPGDHIDVPEVESKRMKEHPKKAAKNPRTGNGGSAEKGRDLSGVKGSIKGKRRGKHKETLDKKPEEQKELLEREIEKLSIRTNSLGKDRNYNRYWFFRREGRLFVESLDSKQWGYFSTKDELDLLMGSLNPKGERERALQRQLEKYYNRISIALQKRSKEISLKILEEEAALRRSTRVQAQPRGGAVLAFLQYVNKWRENKL